MSKDETGKKNNDEVLRAEDILPPYDTKTQQPQESSSADELSKFAVAKEKPAQMKSSKHENATRQKTDIPQFDLAKQILYEQRRIATVKRQSPGRKKIRAPLKSETLSTHSTLKAPLTLSQQGKVIAEIVARDIQRLRKGNI